MKILFILIAFLVTACADKNVLVGKWEYDPDKTLSELKNNPNAPANILKCFELKACGYNVTFIYTPESWVQRNHMSNDQVIDSENIDYQVIEETLNEITVRTLIEDVETEVTFDIINNDYLSFTVEHEGYKWVEYLRRLH